MGYDEAEATSPPEELELSRVSFEFPASSPEKVSSPSVQDTPKKDKLGVRDFVLVRQIGSGDIGRVFLCRRRSRHDDNKLYAMKVIDNDVLALKKKTQRAETERKVLRILNHPFLPCLVAEFDCSNFSGVVVEYCPGGDLHSLRHKQPNNRFSLTSARFYAAEVLVALEYLHILGIVYRDLKPENVLVRGDGHIMLTDFDLSLCADTVPSIESPTSSPETLRTQITRRRASASLSPFSCIFSHFTRSKKIKSVSSTGVFVAEPLEARSRSFVGTHEYVSPEVAAGESHGAAVDWWALGIFIYEMIYGRTPFAGPTNEATLRGILKKPLAFPSNAPRSATERHARDLISRLLNKDPKKRLGSKRGAADIKTHPFFKGLNFALIRSLKPPPPTPAPAPLSENRVFSFGF